MRTTGSSGPTLAEPAAPPPAPASASALPTPRIPLLAAIGAVVVGVAVTLIVRARRGAPC